MASGPDGGPVEGEAVSEHDQRDDYDDEPWRGRAVSGRLITLPADLMWSFGWFQIAVSLYVLFATGQMVVLWFSGSPAGRNPLVPVILLLLVGLLGLVVGRLIVRGGRAMRAGRDYPRAVLAACLTFTSLPCVAALPYTIPLAIWALIVLNRADVRSHFRR
jgi:hypothetical protein